MTGARVLVVVVLILTTTVIQAWDCLPPEGYYDEADGLYGEHLLLALRAIIEDHCSLGYTYARDVMYEELDCLNDNTICCIYTGRCGSNPSACSRSGALANNFNCEHSWPQSSYGSNEPLRSDIFNLHPCDSSTNSRRSNRPYGIVQGQPSWEQGGSKLGSDGSRTVFEPRDEVKGDCARALLYMIVRYQAEELESDAYYMDDRQFEILLEWNHLDPPDEVECQRVDGIYSYQNNRNPFVDFTEFADLIWVPEPTATPTVTPDFLETPIIVITETPVPSTTPTPIQPSGITPLPNVDPSVALVMPDHYFTPGELCWLHAFVSNPGDPIYDSNLVVVLDIGTDDYWFWPSWVHYPTAIDYQPIRVLNPGETGLAILPAFAFPHIEGQADSWRFVAVLMDESMTVPLGPLTEWEFGYGS